MKFRKLHATAVYTVAIYMFGISSTKKVSLLMFMSEILSDDMGERERGQL